jgi:pilus assembly protein CpaC
MSRPVSEWVRALVVLAGVAGLSGLKSPAATGQELGPAGGSSSIIRRISSNSERLDMVIHTSRMITLEKRIPKALVNNPDILDLIPRGANTLQVVAKKTGFTQIVLWDENDQLYTVDVLVTGDARELEVLLARQFPKARLRLDPLASSLLINGYVDDPSHVGRIVEISQDYYPKVITNITVGGVQQILLHIKVMEVSRTKMRSLGFDWAYINGEHYYVQSVSGLLSAFTAPGTVATTGGDTFRFGLVTGGDQFHGFIEALRQNNLLKVLAEPTLVTVSGRAAFFNVGGEIPIPIPQSLGTISIEYKKFGTQVDFVPIVLSNGNIRLEVRPRVSEIDNTRGVVINNITIPGLRTREVDTGVEMRAGQTLAIAGLVQVRTESEQRGLPGLMDLPYLGAAFRRVEDTENEIELLIMVTPELVEPMEYDEVPPCGPGTRTTSPRDCEFYLKGHIEVPRCCDGQTPEGFQGAGGPAQQSLAPLNVEELPQQMGPPRTNDRPGPGDAPGGAKPQSKSPARRRSQPTAGPVAPTPANEPAAPINRQTPQARYAPPRSGVPARPVSRPGFIGPTGYDISK